MSDVQHTLSTQQYHAMSNNTVPALTNEQRRVLQALLSSFWAPTLPRLAQATALSVEQTHDAVNSLLMQGIIGIAIGCQYGFKEITYTCTQEQLDTLCLSEDDPLWQAALVEVAPWSEHEPESPQA